MQSYYLYLYFGGKKDGGANTRRRASVQHGAGSPGSQRQAKKMLKRLVALPSRQAAEHRRGGGREMASIPWVEGRTGGG